MGGWAFSILFVMLLLFSVYIGFLVGQGVSERFVVTRRDYWLANLAGFAVTAVFIMLIASLPMLYAVAVGGLAGFVAGLKMDFGEAVGPWKILERFMGIKGGAPTRSGVTSARGEDEAPSVERAREKRESAVKEERRRRRRAGTESDLISVEGEHTSAHARSDKKGVR